MNKVIYIVGPTASGKTGLAIKIAKKYSGEIICADSRTIYKGLDIGTAKPTPEEQDGVVHYGLDLVLPSEKFSAAQFMNLAKELIVGIQERGKLPIIVGGTGLYINGLYFNFTFGPKADEVLRKKLEKLSLIELQEMINEKKLKMPENFKNKRYLIRAIERGDHESKTNEPDKSSLIIGINPGKETLSKRIADRAEVIFNSDVLSEAKRLFEEYGYDCPGASGNIYRVLKSHFIDGLSIEECKNKFITLDKKLAKRQITWFKRNKNIKWFNSALEAEMYLGSIL